MTKRSCAFKLREQLKGRENMFDARVHDVHRAYLFQEAPMSVQDWPGGRKLRCQKLDRASMSGTGDKFMRSRKGPGHPKSRARVQARVESVKP